MNNTPFLKTLFLKHKRGNSLPVQWLGLVAFTAGARVQSLVGEIRSRKPCSAAEINKQIKLNFKKFKNKTQQRMDSEQSETG